MYFDKKCTKCNIIKKVSEFSPRKESKSPNWSSQCKKCLAIRSKEQWLNYSEEKQNIIRKRSSIWQNERILNPKKYPEWHKNYKRKLQKLKEQRPLIRKLKGIDWTPPKPSSKPLKRKKENTRKQIVNLLKNNSKRYSSLIGCSGQELKKYLESKFKPHMTWNNYGNQGWHIDHIIPLGEFNLFDKKQLRQANHFRNLQPLWSNENVNKADKIIDGQLQLLF
jgi:hypothetical protein